MVWRSRSSEVSTVLPARGQTEVLTVLLRLEAIAVPAAAAVPEPSTLTLLQVKEPTHCVVLTRTHFLAQETVIFRAREGGREGERERERERERE